MKTRSLLCACFAAALLGGSALANEKGDQPRASSRISKVLLIPGMDQAPVPLRVVHPPYPYELRREGIQGIVTVDMLVDSMGRVVQAELVSSTEPELNSLALNAAVRWSFVPASAKGQPITTRVRVPFEFVMPQLVAAKGR